MVGIVVTGSQIGKDGIFAFDCGRNSCLLYGVPVYRTPFVGVELSAKKVQILGLRRRSCGSVCASLGGNSDNVLVRSGVVEKEFEFKPSFDEYVKAMDSIKTVREKRRVAESEKSGDGFGRREEEFEGHLERRSIDGGMEEDEVSGSGDGDVMEVRENAVNGKAHYLGPEHRLFKDDLDGEESKWGSELKRGRWLKYEKDSVGSRLKDSRQVLKKDRPRDKRSMERVSKREERGVSSRFRSNPIKVDNAVRGKLPYKHGKPEDLEEDELDGDERISGSMVGRVPRGALGNRWSRYEENSVDSRSERSHEMLGKRVTDDSPENEEPVERTFKREELGVRGYATSSRFPINPIQVKKVTGKDYTSTRGTLTRSSKAFFDKDDSLKNERAAFKSFEESSDIMDKPRVSRMEMEERIQKLANCLNGADIHMPEWMFSRMMRSAQIRFSDHSILRVIQLLGKLGNWRRVLQVIEWLQLRERFKSYKPRHIYTAALSALQKARRPVEALNVFRVMQQQWNLYPDLTAYHSIAITLGQAGYMKELFDVIDSMRFPPKKSFRTRALDDRDPRLDPDTIVYNAVLNACVQRKQWEGAFWVLQQLKQQGLPPSSGTYGLVMEVMFVCGKYNLVHEFFKKMQRSSIPNALTYRVLLNTLWKEGKIDETVLVVQDMERRGIVGSAALYYDFARCLCSAGRCEEALMQIEKICKVASKPLVVTYTGLIQACLDTGNIQNGAYIFNQMHKFCSPNLVTCNIMLKAYLEHAMFEEARKLFEKMLENGNHISNKHDYKTRVIPDIYTFNTMLDACFTAKRWDDFEYVYERMLYHGFRFNSRRHLRMILDASNTKKGELVEITWEYLARTDRIPPSALAKERFCIMLEKNDHAAAMACITNHEESELPGFSNRALLNLLKENGERFNKDSLVRFIHGLSMHSSRSDSPNPVLRNLLTACEEYVRTHLNGD